MNVTNMTTEVNKGFYHNIIIEPFETGFSTRIVKSKRIDTTLSKYMLYHYDKTILSVLDKVNNKYRSVIFAYPENNLLCFSPSKSIGFSDFINKYPKIEKNIVISQKIEGVSIQLFYDYRIKSWEISTKTNIGGNYWFFAKTNNIEYNSNKCSTFYDMFLDALSEETTKKISEFFLD